MDTLAAPLLPDRDPALTDFADTSEVADNERALAALYGVRRLERMESHLEERITTLETQMERAHLVLFPEPDFDSDWVVLEAQGGLRWDVEEDRDIARADVLIRTGPDSFEAVPSSPTRGDVWARPYPPDSKHVRSYMIYSSSAEPHEVRIQGWYESR